jgi:PKD repeat protein
MKRAISVIVAAVAAVAAVSFGVTAASAQVGLVAPVANPGGPYSGVAGVPITFDGRASTGDSLTFQWNFGDGITASGALVTHTYAAAGTYTVTLTVVDVFGQSVTGTTTALVSATGLPATVTSQCPLMVMDGSPGKVVFTQASSGLCTTVAAGTPTTGTVCVLTAAGTVVCTNAAGGRVSDGPDPAAQTLPACVVTNGVLVCTSPTNP